MGQRKVTKTAPAPHALPPPGVAGWKGVTWAASARPPDLAISRPFAEALPPWLLLSSASLLWPVLIGYWFFLGAVVADAAKTAAASSALLLLPPPLPLLLLLLLSLQSG